MTVLRNARQCLNQDCREMPGSAWTAEQCMTVLRNARQCLNCWAVHDSAEKCQAVPELLSSAWTKTAAKCQAVSELLSSAWTKTAEKSQAVSELLCSAWTAEQCITVPEMLRRTRHYLNCLNCPPLNLNDRPNSDQSIDLSIDVNKNIKSTQSR